MIVLACFLLRMDGCSLESLKTLKVFGERASILCSER